MSGRIYFAHKFYDISPLGTDYVVAREVLPIIPGQSTNNDAYSGNENPKTQQRSLTPEEIAYWQAKAAQAEADMAAAGMIIEKKRGQSTFS